MYLGYNTNGFAHHRLDDALEILAEIGYQGVGLTIDWHVLYPWDAVGPVRVSALRRRLESLQLRAVLETGARYLLDPRRKHQPTLISPSSDERARRHDFLQRCIQIASALGIEVVSLWSGAAIDDAIEPVLMDRLLPGLDSLLRTAENARVRLALEPEPGMFIDTLSAWNRVAARLDHPHFGLTLDVGHVHCQGEGDIAQCIGRFGAKLWNVHLEDMKVGIHDHLFFGEGEICFPPIFGTLARQGYAGGVFVELSRHSHDAVVTAQRAMEQLRAYQAAARTVS